MNVGRVGAPSRRDTVVVAAGFFASSGLGLVFLAVIARWLTPGQNATFLVVWGLLMSLGSVVGSVEPEISRLSAGALLVGRRLPRQTVQTVVLVGGSLAVVSMAALFTPAGNVVVARSPVLAVLVVLSVPGLAGLVLVRGSLIGAHAIGRYALVILGENALRFLLALAVVLPSQFPASVTLAILIVVPGCFVWIPLVGWLLRHLDAASGLVPWRQVGVRVGALAVANALAALVFTGFPTVTTLVLGGSAGLAELFAVLTLARVPLVVFAPLQALAVPVVVRWMWEGRFDQLRRVMALVDVSSVVLAVLGGALATVIGPILVPVVMGSRYDPRGLMCGVAVAATSLLVAVTLRSAVLIAYERPWTLVAAWSVAVLGAIAVMELLEVSPELRGLYGFGAAAVLAFMATDAGVLWRGGKPHRPVTP